MPVQCNIVQVETSNLTCRTDFANAAIFVVMQAHEHAFVKKGIVGSKNESFYGN